MTSGSRLAAYAITGLAVLLAGSSMLPFAWFLFKGPLDLVTLDISEGPALLLNAGLCLAFFAQHTGMIRRSFHRWTATFIAAHYQGTVYTIASGIVLLLLVVLWQGPVRTLVEVEGGLRWLPNAVFLLAVAGMGWAYLALRSDLLGLDPISDHLRGTAPPRKAFVLRGPYRWVRHPIYLCVLLLLWSRPDLATDRLLFNVLFTVWIVAGAVLEERDLVADFGEEFRAYQRRVPMLLPWRLRPAGGTSDGPETR